MHPKNGKSSLINERELAEVILLHMRIRELKDRERELQKRLRQKSSRGGLLWFAAKLGMPASQ